MTENENRQILINKGLRLVDVAEAMHLRFGITVKSANVMLQHLLSEQRWYPVYAKWLAETYGLQIERPAYLRPVRERLKLQAA